MQSLRWLPRPLLACTLVTSGCWLTVHGCARFGYDVLSEQTGSDVNGPGSGGADIVAAGGTGGSMTCADRVQGERETDIDCGGNACAPCADGARCAGASDCESGICVSGACEPASCTDGVQNQDETAVDCGGVLCAPCASCSDSMQGPGETGIDCGSTCGPCPNEAACQSATDCLSLNCSAAGSCIAATCSDGIANQGETSVDCGGPNCPACPSCSDGIVNQGETGVDCGGASCAACGVNTPPLVSFSVTPGVGSHDGTPATTFQGDASATTDREDSAGALDYAWDWDGDGTIDGNGVTASHVYAATGTFSVRLTVQDSGGLSATSAFIVVVSAESGIVRVTTEADENDPGATPASPGGTGLSLREAIQFANGAVGRQSILVPAGFSIALDSQLPNPADPLGMDIVGDGVRLDGSGTGPADDCLAIASPDNRVFGFEIQNCHRSPLRLAPGATGSECSRLKIHDNPQPVLLSDTDIHFGPYNEVSGSSDYCISVVALNVTLDWNFIHDCGTRGIDLTGASDAALVLGNVITRCETGILFGNGADSPRLLHNVVHGNRGNGLFAAAAVSGIVIQNNIFSANAGFGVSAEDGAFSGNDHNDYFGNGSGTCTFCSLGAGSSTADPRYMDVGADDFRLQPDSVLIDAGLDTGADVNGPDPANGLFNGSSPDIGARETP